MSKGRTIRSTKGEVVAAVADSISTVLAYTYAGAGEEEISSLREAASWLAKTRFGRALAELANDLEAGIAMGVISPGDTLYQTV
jgi:hypothetical protein